MTVLEAVEPTESASASSVTETSVFLDAFPLWVDGLGEDVRALTALLANDGCAMGCKAMVIGALNYLFMAIGLVPDGIEDIGYLDDAFVLRVAARLATTECTCAHQESSPSALVRLSHECEIVKEFLGADFERLEAYVAAFRFGVTRDRSVRAILLDDDVRRSFLYELRSFAETYESSRFAYTEESLHRIRALLDVTLPR